MPWNIYVIPAGYSVALDNFSLILADHSVVRDNFSLILADHSVVRDNFSLILADRSVVRDNFSLIPADFSVIPAQAGIHAGTQSALVCLMTDSAAKPVRWPVEGRDVYGRW